MITFTQGSVRVELPVEAEHGPAPRYLPIPGTATPPLVEMPDDDESPEQHLATVDVFGEEVRTCRKRVDLVEMLVVSSVRDGKQVNLVETLVVS